MLSSEAAQVFAVVVYGSLAAAGAYGRPPLPRRQSRSEKRATDHGGSPTLEALWLASLAAVLLYPLGILFAPAVLLASPLTLRFPGDEVAQVAGLILVLVGAGLAGWAFRSLGRFTTVRIQLSPDHAIVRVGPYARVRHPMYTANILLGVGVTLAFLSLVLWAPVVIIVLIAHFRARSEERMFLASPLLGKNYEEYMTSTGRFLPIGRLVPPEKL